METKINQISSKLFSVSDQCIKSWEEQTDIHINRYASGIFIKLTTGDDHRIVKQIIKNN